MQDIFASDGPSMAKPRPPVPAPLQQQGEGRLKKKKRDFIFCSAEVCFCHVPGFHCELIWLVSDASFQSRTVHADTSRVAPFGDGDTERTLGHRGAVVANLHAVRA